MIVCYDVNDSFYFHDVDDSFYIYDVDDNFMFAAGLGSRVYEQSTSLNFEDRH